MTEHTPLYSCCNQACACEVSYHEEDFHAHPDTGEPICNDCYDGYVDDAPAWHELKQWVSPQTAERDRLKEQVSHLMELITDIENPGGDYYTGLHCGIEDVGITDRYQAADHGWNKAFEYIDSIFADILKEAEGKS